MKKRYYFLLPVLISQVAAIEHQLRHDSSKSRSGQDSQPSLMTKDEGRQHSINNKAKDMLNTLFYWANNNTGDIPSLDKNNVRIVESRVPSRKLRRETGNSVRNSVRDLHSPTDPLTSSDHDDEGNSTTVSTIVQELSNGTSIVTTTTVTTTTTTTKIVTTIVNNENDTEIISDGNPITETNSTTTFLTSNNNETATFVLPVENSTSTTSSSSEADDVMSMKIPDDTTPLLTSSTNNVDIQGYNHDMGTLAQYNGGNTDHSVENTDNNLLLPLVLDSPLKKSEKNIDDIITDSSSNSSSSTSLTTTDLSIELNQATQTPKKASILSGSFKIDSCTYTTAIYADVVDYSTRLTIGEVYYVIPETRQAKTQLVSGGEKCATEPPGGQESVHCGFADDRLHAYQQSTVGADGSGIACQWNISSIGSNKKKIQQQQHFSIKVGSNPSFLPDFEAHNLVVNRAGHNARTDDFEFRNNFGNGGVADDELLVCHLLLDIHADSFDLEETTTTTTTTTTDPSSSSPSSTVSTITIITPSTRLLYDANPRLQCVDNDAEMISKTEFLLYEFAFSCPTLDDLIQDVISSKQSVFGIPNGTAFGHCNIQVGTEQIRTMVRL